MENKKHILEPQKLELPPFSQFWSQSEKKLELFLENTNLLSQTIHVYVTE